MSEMSDISFFDVFYGQFTIAVAGGGGALPYWAMGDLLRFGPPCLAKTPELGIRNSWIRLNQVEFHSSSVPSWLSWQTFTWFHSPKTIFGQISFIFNNKYSHQTVEVDHIIMFFRLATLPMSWNFSQTRPKGPLKWKKKSETRYTFSTKILEPLEGEGILGAPPHQLLIKYPSPQELKGTNCLASILAYFWTLPVTSSLECWIINTPASRMLWKFFATAWAALFIPGFLLHPILFTYISSQKLFPGVAMLW